MLLFGLVVAGEESEAFNVRIDTSVCKCICPVVAIFVFFSGQASKDVFLLRMTFYPCNSDGMLELG